MAETKVFKMQALAMEREIHASPPTTLPYALRELIELVPGMLSLVDASLARIDAGEDDLDEAVACRLVLGDVWRIVEAVTAALDGHAVSLENELPMFERAAGCWHAGQAERSW